jgi:S-(hydroxymethyl)glutathione dehydrogenase / alcohol dehydrogenase
VKTEAAVLPEPGRPLSLEEVQVDAPKAGEVLVRLLASGVCHSDLHAVEGHWKLPMPLVLGHEGSGVVEEVGPGVHDIAVGDHVVLSWFAPCRRCAYCVSGRAWACTTTRADYCVMEDGTTRLRRLNGDTLFPFLAVGSFARHAVVPESGAVVVPAAVPAAVAALIGCAVTTGVGAVLNTARVPAGSAAVVIGCGGVGLSAVMGLRLAGAHPVVAVDLSDERLAVAEQLGASHTVNGAGDVRAEVRAIADGGVDYVVEANGSPATVELAVALLRRGGTAVLIGLPPAGVTARLDVLAVVNLGKTIMGCAYGSSVPAVDFPRIAELYLAGRLPIDRLVSDHIVLEDVDAALEAMRRREGVRSVVVY